MLSIRNVYPKDAEVVCAFLQKRFPESALDLGQWKRMFFVPWIPPAELNGFALFSGLEIKGFLGLIFASRQILGKTELFCNMTSWAVHPDASGSSLLLLNEMLKLKAFTFTNFSPSSTVSLILKKYRFLELPTARYLLLGLPSASRQGWKLVTELSKIEGLLLPRDLRVFRDHRQTNAIHFVMQGAEGCCYAVATKSAALRGFAKVEYISDRDLFIHGFNRLRFHVCCFLGVWGLVLEKWRLKKCTLKWMVESERKARAFYKSDTVAELDIDTLYSEVILLHS